MPTNLFYLDIYFSQIKEMVTLALCFTFGGNMYCTMQMILKAVNAIAQYESGNVIYTLYLKSGFQNKQL